MTLIQAVSSHHHHEELALLGEPQHHQPYVFWMRTPKQNELKIRNISMTGEVTQLLIHTVSLFVLLLRCLIHTLVPLFVLLLIMNDILKMGKGTLLKISFKAHSSWEKNYKIDQTQWD